MSHRPLVEIATKRLRLLLESPEETLARIDSLSPADRAEVSSAWLERVRVSPASDPWTHGFSMIDGSSGARVGSCGFKGPPDGQGMVEIAYGDEPNHQGRGYATEAAGALTGFAFASGQVRLVRAHTLPGSGASTRVLEKCGFSRVGDVVDPEDGLVWRWERGSS